MNPLNLVPSSVWALALAGACAWGWWQYDDKRDAQVTLARVDAALAQQKLDASTKLLEETTRANNAEHKLQAALAKREELDAKNREVSGAYHNALADLARAESGRLRDPAGCRSRSDKPQAPSTAATIDRSGNPAETGGLLSESLSGLLQSEAKVNDRINDAYTACRADSFELRTIIDEYNLQTQRKD